MHKKTIAIETYFRVNGEFVPVKSYQGNITDPDYIEGAIEILIDDEEVLTKDMWDYVDQLWGYLLDGLKDMTKSGSTEIYFPDQPIKISMQSDILRNSISLNVDYQNRSAQAEYDEFFSKMLEEAHSFYCKLSELLPEDQSHYEGVFCSISALNKIIP